MRMSSLTPIGAFILAWSSTALAFPLSDAINATTPSSSSISTTPVPSIIDSLTTTSGTFSSATASSTISAFVAATSSSSSALPSSSGNASMSIAERLGLPPLTEDDINFILSGEMWDQANLTDEKPQSVNATLARREDISTGANTPAKWTSLGMDLWLEDYVTTRIVPGPDGSMIKLKDSTNFLRDFWLSTGEENTYRCNKITEVCDPAERKDAAYKDLKPDDRLRAFMVRQAISIWKQELKDAFNLFSWAASDAQGMISEMRTAFTEDKATKPGDPMEVVVLVLGAVGAAFPALAPAAGAIAGIYALNKAISSRDTTVDGTDDTLTAYVSEKETPRLLYTEDGLPYYLDKIEEDLGNESEQPIHQKRKETLWGNINNLKQEVKKLQEMAEKSAGENPPPPEKSTFDVWNGRVKTAGDVMDKSAKAVVAYKALHPDISSYKVDTWTHFDTRMKDIFDTFPKAVEDGYNLNSVTWSYKKGVSKDGVEVGAVGMRELLAGGQWFKISAGNDKQDVTGQRQELMAFYRKIVYMEVLKAQGIYLWRQHFDNEAACKTALQEYKSKDLVSEVSNQCVRVGSGSGSWHLRIARRPKTYDGVTGQLLYPSDFLFSWNRYQVKLATDNATGNAYLQRISDYQSNSAAISRFTDQALTAAKLGVSTRDIFNYADACQVQMGDPFKKASPTRDDIYAPMAFNGLDKMSSTSVPLCLFSLPIIDINNSELAAWCKTNIGEIVYTSGRHRRGDGWKPLGDVCASWDYWGAFADVQVCVERTRDWKNKVSAPGCDGHDKGWYFQRDRS